MFPRKKARFAVQLPTTFSGKEISGVGTVLNISPEGCAVLSDVLLNISSYVTSRIDLNSDDPPLNVDLAVVRWSSEQKFGLEFIRMEGKEQERLTQFVKTLEVDPLV